VQIVDVIATGLETATELDEPAARVSKAVSKLTHRPGVSSVLSGTVLGHPLHPVLTDLPIGFWSSSFFLDLLPGSSTRRISQAFVGIGILTAIPTALTGASDWADTEGPPRRVGLVHGALNSAGLVCYTGSWVARRRGHHLRGVLYGMVGATAMTAAAALGGHLVYRLGTGVDNNAFDAGPDDWTVADRDAPPTPLPGAVEGSLVKVAGAPVLVTRAGGLWRGIGARCSHRGGPLEEGRFADDCVTCPWHQSRFRLHDGSIVDGPAIAPQPRYEVRAEGDSFTARRAR